MTILEGYLNPDSGELEWLAQECPQCMKLISAAEWAAHLAWHEEALEPHAPGCRYASGECDCSFPEQP